MVKRGWVGDIHEIDGAGHDVMRPETSEKFGTIVMHWKY
jgi:hypothetical protein